MRLFFVSLVVALVSAGCSKGFSPPTGPTPPANQVAQSQTPQTLAAPGANGGSVNFSAAIPPHSPGVYTVNLKVKERGEYQILVSTDKMMPDRSNVRFASSEITLRVVVDIQGNTVTNPFTITDPVGEATYIVIRNLSGPDLTIENYSILYNSM